MCVETPLEFMGQKNENEVFAVILENSSLCLLEDVSYAPLPLAARSEYLNGQDCLNLARNIGIARYL